MIQKNNIVKYMDDNLVKWFGGLNTFKKITDSVLKKCNNILIQKINLTKIIENVKLCLKVY